MTARTGHVVAASNRAAAGVYEDRTGPVIVEWLRARGYRTPDPEVVPDGDPVRGALRRAIDNEVNVVITTGGTGINPTDRTPEVTGEVLDYPIPGLADAVRNAGLPQVPTAVLSRGLAGVSGRTLIVNLPGSRGGVQDGLTVLDGVLDHAIDQLHGGDHVRDEHAEVNHAEVNHAETKPAEVRPAAGVVRAEVTESPLSVEELVMLVDDRGAGAVVTFSGVVRDHDGGRTVRELEYEGHPHAAEVITEVAQSVASTADGVRAIAVAHRIGLLAIGEVALACAVAADHRQEAFRTCAVLVDEVKRRLPVWKRQVFGDGTEQWVNCP